MKSFCLALIISYALGNPQEAGTAGYRNSRGKNHGAPSRLKTPPLQFATDDMEDIKPMTHKSDVQQEESIVLDNLDDTKRLDRKNFIQSSSSRWERIDRVYHEDERTIGTQQRVEDPKEAASFDGAQTIKEKYIYAPSLVVANEENANSEPGAAATTRNIRSNANAIGGSENTRLLQGFSPYYTPYGSPYSPFYSPFYSPIAASPTPPGNPLLNCDQARSLNLGGQFRTETVFLEMQDACREALVEEALPCRGQVGSVNNPFWFIFSGSDANVTVSTDGSNYDTQIAVFEGSACSFLTCIAYDDDSGQGRQSEATFFAQNQQQYFIRVDDYPCRIHGSFSVGESYTTSVQIYPEGFPPTAAPTTLPSSSPSAPPTSSPSSSPTNSPSLSPTNVPTSTPSLAPTSTPTPPPTPNPSPPPTPNPSPLPTPLTAYPTPFVTSPSTPEQSMGPAPTPSLAAPSPTPVPAPSPQPTLQSTPPVPPAGSTDPSSPPMQSQPPATGQKADTTPPPSPGSGGARGFESQGARFNPSLFAALLPIIAGSFFI